MKKYFIVLLSMGNLAFAGPGLDQLTAFSTSLKTLEATFVQTTINADLQEQERTVGTLYLQKPGKFRWDYQRPYEQQIVSDGDTLYIFDVDLDQVTIRPVQGALGAAPISLLTNIVDLQQQFNIIELGKIEGREHIQLEAKVKDTDYHYFLLALGEHGLETIELKDTLGQVTRIQLSNIKNNQAIDAAVFTFTAPSGVDVIDSTKKQ